MTRAKWTTELIEAEIMRSVEAIGLNRMPTANELRRLHKDSRLAAQVSRRGGFDFWADRLNLPRAQHASRVGWKWEKWFVDEARLRGMSAHRPSGVKSTDVVVDGVEVEVKVSNVGHFSNWSGWAFRIHNKKLPPVLALVRLVDGVFDSLLLVPSPVVPRTMVCITDRKRGKYEKYEDNWAIFG